MSAWNANPDARTERTALGLPIAPMTVADILDGSFKMVKRNWKAFAILSIPFSIPGILFTYAQYAVQGTTGGSIRDMLADPEAYAETSSPLASGEFVFTAAAFALLIGGVVLSFLLTPNIYAVAIRVVAGSYLDHERPLSTVASQTFRRVPTLLLASLLAVLAVIGAAAPVVIPIALLAASFPPALLMLVFAIIPIVVVGTMLAFIYQVVVIEDASASRSLSRSWFLVSKRFFPILGIYILATIISSVIGSVVATPLLFLGIGGGYLFEPVEYVATAIASVISTFISLAVQASVLTLLYFDARIRFEGFDLSLKARRNAGDAFPGSSPSSLNG